MARRASRPTLWLPVKKRRSYFFSSRAAFSARHPVTTATYSGGKHSVRSSRITWLVAGE